jgi:two-component system chemotaxis response regulator CheB
LKRLREYDAHSIAQDRASSLVCGMPGEAVRLEAGMRVQRPSNIGKLPASQPAAPFPSSVSHP